jgi:hypothetical protein
MSTFSQAMTVNNHVQPAMSHIVEISDMPTVDMFVNRNAKPPMSRITEIRDIYTA